jgi:hypothetical protein
VSALRTLVPELRAAAATPRFWGTVARSGIPVAGVFAWDWPAAVVVIYFLAEIWLFLALRMSFEIAVDPKFLGRAQAGTREIVSQALKILLVAAPVTAALIGLFAFPLLAIMFARDGGWRELIGVVLGSREGLIGMATMAAFLFADALQFARRYPRRDAEQEAIDEYRAAAMVMRIACLLVIGLVAIFVPYGSAGRALVVAIALVSIWIEGMPRHAAKTFGYRPRLPRSMEQ